jgi:hypothetical protein
MKLSGPHIAEGVITGLIVAAIGYCVLQWLKRADPSTHATQGLAYNGQPTPTVGTVGEGLGFY